MNLYEKIKATLFPVNRNLFMLKMSFFFTQAIWVSVFPYSTLILTQIIDYRELAITFASIPVSSIFGPIVTGFIGDKIGNYKIILICTTLLGGFIHLPILWMIPRQQMQPFSNATHLNNETFNVENSTSYEPFDTNNSNEPYNYYVMFSSIMVIRFLGFFAVDSTNNLLDSCGLAISKKEGAEFGKQKMFITCAQVVVPIVCGRLIDLISGYQGFIDYSMAFYMGTGFSVIASLMIFQLDIEVQQNKKSFMKTARAVIGMIDVDIFMLAQIVIGMCWGLHMNFFSVYVTRELEGSNKTLFGAALSIAGIGSVIVLFTSKMIIDKFGEANSVAFALMCYSIRFIVYYYLENPWIILLIESFDGLSGFLSIVAGNYYCSIASPPGMLASLNSILSAAVFGAGRGLGTIVGSLTVADKRNGIRSGYIAFGILAAVTSVAYSITYHLYLKRIEKIRLSSKSEQGAKEVNLGEDNLACQN